MGDDDLRKKRENEIGPFRLASKQDAARRQILMAALCAFDGEWECAITLAGAAEGQIEDTEQLSMFDRLKKRKPDSRSEREHIAFINRLRDWLKHSGDQKDKFIYEFEAVFMVARALMKYWNAYHDNLDEIKLFDEWRTNNGYSLKSELPKGALRKILEGDGAQ